MISMVPKTARPDAAGEAHDLAAAVADGTDAVEGSLDAGAVVLAERADVVDDVLDVVRPDLTIEQDLLATTTEARLRAAAKVHHHLDDAAHVIELTHALADLRRQRIDERLEVIVPRPQGRGHRGRRQTRAPGSEASPRSPSGSGAAASGQEVSWRGDDMGSSDGGVDIRRLAPARVPPPAPVPP